MEYELMITILLFIIVILMCYKIFYADSVINVKKETANIPSKVNKKILKSFPNSKMKNKNNIDLNSLEDIDSIVIDN